MYDGAGKELWRKQLAGATQILGVGVSGDGRYAIVSADKHAPGPLTQDVVEAAPVFLLDGDGSVLPGSATLRGLGQGPFRFEPSLEAFVDGGEGFYSIVTVAGHKTVIDVQKAFPAGKTELKIRDGKIGASRQFLLGLLKHRIVLLVLDMGGRLVACKTIKAGPRSAEEDGADFFGHGEEPEEGDVDGRSYDEKLKWREPLLGLALSPDGRFVTVRVDRELRTYEVRPRNGGGQR
jgi:hypothetical protein